MTQRLAGEAVDRTADHDARSDPAAAATATAAAQVVGAQAADPVAAGTGEQPTWVAVARKGRGDHHCRGGGRGGGARRRDGGAGNGVQGRGASAMTISRWRMCGSPCLLNLCLREF